MSEPNTDADRRQIKRLALRFAIEVCGRDAMGNLFRDDTVTGDVNDQGCQFDLLRRVNCGDFVTIQLKTPVAEAPPEPHLFRVVWITPSEHGWSIGARKLEPTSIWPMHFPPAPSPSS